MTHTPHAFTPRHDPAHLRKDAIRNRELLIATARQVFAERGLDITMDLIAHRAGVGLGTVYRHFANKYELANAVFDEVVERLVADAEEAQPPTADPWTALCRVVERVLSAQSSDRGIREMILVLNQDDWAHHDSLLAPVRSAFKRAQHAGVVRTDASFSDLVIVLIMLCTVMEQDVADGLELWRRYLPTMLHGLASPPKVAMPGAPISDSGLRRGLASGLLKHRFT